MEQSIDSRSGERLATRWHEKEKLTNAYKTAATDGDNYGLILTSTFLRTCNRSTKMKRIAPLAGLVVATLLGGCAVYPDGTPMYGNGYGGYDGSAYPPGGAVVPQTNVYLGYSDYAPGRYYGPGPGPGYRGYPDRGHPDDNDWHHGDHGDHGNNHGNYGGGPGQPHGGPPPQGAVGGPRGPSGMNGGPRPGAGGPPPAQPQAGNGGGRGYEGARNAPERQPGQPANH
jgi:hypothetical protein